MAITEQKPNNRPSATGELTRDLRAAVTGLRSTLVEALDAAKLSAERRPRALASRLSVDPKLAWRIVHLTDPECSIESARFVPGPGSLRTLTKSLAKLGATTEQCDGIMSASAAFEAAVDRHVGTRRGLDAFLASAASDPNDATAIELRRAGFESNASGLGIRAASQDLIAAQFVGEDPGTIDIAGLRATLGLELLRPQIPWRIATPYTDEKTAATRKQKVEPLDPAEDDRIGLHIVKQLCSQPVPDFLPHTLPSGNREYELVSGCLGAQGRRDLVFADRWRESDPVTVSRTEVPGSRLISRMRVPCERARWIMCTPVDLFPHPVPQTDFYTMMWRGDTSFQDGDRLPLKIGIEIVDEASIAARDPRLSELLDWFLHRVRRYSSEWIITYSELAYPPLVSAATFRWERRVV